MCGALVQRPSFHAVGDGVGDGGVEVAAVVDRLAQLLICVTRQVLSHGVIVKDVRAICFDKGIAFLNHFLSPFQEKLWYKNIPFTPTKSIVYEKRL